MGGLTASSACVDASLLSRWGSYWRAHREQPHVLSRSARPALGTPRLSGTLQPVCLHLPRASGAYNQSVSYARRNHGGKKRQRTDTSDIAASHQQSRIRVECAVSQSCAERQ